jgi:endo-1,4-beta-xylanase
VNQRYGITIWGVCDANSWIMPMFGLRDWPLPFDSLYRKKAAYYGFLNGLKEKQPGKGQR